MNGQQAWAGPAASRSRLSIFLSRPPPRVQVGGRAACRAVLTHLPQPAAARRLHSQRRSGSDQGPRAPHRRALRSACLQRRTPACFGRRRCRQDASGVLKCLDTYTTGGAGHGCSSEHAVRGLRLGSVGPARTAFASRRKQLLLYTQSFARAALFLPPRLHTRTTTTTTACSPYQAGWNKANASGEVEALSNTRRKCAAAACPLSAHAHGEAALGGDWTFWL